MPDRFAHSQWSACIDHRYLSSGCPVLSAHDLTALLAVCAGKECDDKRDTAFNRLFVDTGARWVGKEVPLFEPGLRL